MAWQLSNQLCFLLYANSRHIIKMYKDLLDPLGLTYTQYITLIALWEEDHQTVSHLGYKLALDSGTLTPLLKKLEKDGLITRSRDIEDERRVWIDLTEQGKKLSKKAEHVPEKLASCVEMPKEDIYKLFDILTRLHQKNQACDVEEDI
ncbi:MAG: MarR family transcriptional regulator [Tenericutes bacterium HGW-Tenericutes-6]|jgi:DNA-binding MarR family transcriptional regulator|nr:MAG: MarR family transcriptional regulator [Tenericutes bacterium HGW-Tenericutes-6]